MNMRWLSEEVVKAHTELRISLRPRSFGPKVVCIGYNKTGTTSVGRALESLGFFHLTYRQPHWRAYKQGRIENLLNVVTRVDSLDDLPWLKEDIFPYIDQRFPGSRFIYLERDEESWRRSFMQWRDRVFGYLPDLDKAADQFREHKAFVEEYFAQRPHDVLKLNVCDPNPFDRLAAFCGKLRPQESFPHETSSTTQ